MPKGKNIANNPQACDNPPKPTEGVPASAFQFDQKKHQGMYETADIPPAHMSMVEHLVAIIRIFDQWAEAAKGGDDKAVMALCLAAKQAAAGLEIAGEDNVRKHAQTQASWPVLMMPDSRAWRISTEAYLKRIGVGKASRHGASSGHLVKTPSEIKDVAGLLFRFADLSGSMVSYATTGSAMKEAVIVGPAEVREKVHRMGKYLLNWAALLSHQLRLIHAHLCRILEVSPKGGIKEFAHIADRCSRLGPLSKENFKEWFAQCQAILVQLTDDKFFLPGAKLRNHGSAKARQRICEDGTERDSAYRDGILLNLKEAMRSFVEIPR